MLKLLGLAQKAGKLLLGERAVREGLTRGKIKLLLLAEDAPDTLKNRYVGWCRDKEIPVLMPGKKLDIGAAVGKPPLSMVGVTADGFAAALLKTLGTQV